MGEWRGVDLYEQERIIVTGATRWAGLGWAGVGWVVLRVAWAGCRSDSAVTAAHSKWWAPRDGLGGQVGRGAPDRRPSSCIRSPLLLLPSRCLAQLPIYIYIYITVSRRREAVDSIITCSASTCELPTRCTPPAREGSHTPPWAWQTVRK